MTDQCTLPESCVDYSGERAYEVRAMRHKHVAVWVKGVHSL